MNTFQAVVVEQPHKIPLLAGAIQIANGLESAIGKLVVESFHVRLQEAVEQGKWNSVKLISRFITMLFPIIAEQGKGVFKLLNVLLDRAIELQATAADARSPLGEELYTAVLLAIPYLISTTSTASDEVKQSIKDLISKSQNFTVVQDAKALEILAPWTGDKKPYEPKNFVLVTRGVVDSIAETLTVRNLLDIPNLIEPDLPKEGPISQHVFPAINIAENIQDLAPYKGLDYQTPRLFFSIYLPDVLETVPPVETLESVLFRDISTDIINNMDFNRKEVARQLITLDLFFGKDTFTEPGIAMDRLQSLHATNPSESTWKVEDVALEAVLDEIFKLPTQAFYGSYFHAILIEACIMAPQAIAPVFGRAIRFLYSHLTEMDIELQYRFLDWFSHHLSNFGFSWKWQEWKDDVGLPDLHPRKVFMKQLIVKEVRLSYSQRVKETLPEEMLEFVPATPEEPLFKYFEPGSQYQNEVQQLTSAFREGKEKEEIDTLLQEISQKVNNLSEESGDPESSTKTLVDIVVSTLCYLGNRSISHAESWISRSKDLLLDVCPNDYNSAVTSVLEYWVDQPYMGLLVVMQLVKQDIVPPSAYVTALFEPEMQHLLTTSHGWDMLLRVIDFTLQHDQYNSGSEKNKVFTVLLTQFNKLIEEQELALSEEEMEVEEDVLQARESKKWAVWWSKGTIRSLIRKYYAEFRDNTLGSNIQDEYITGLLEQSRSL